MRLRYLLRALPIIGMSTYSDGVGHVQLQQVPVTANPLLKKIYESKKSAFRTNLFSSYPTFIIGYFHL